MVQYLPRKRERRRSPLGPALDPGSITLQPPSDFIVSQNLVDHLQVQAHNEPGLERRTGNSSMPITLTSMARLLVQ